MPDSQPDVKNDSEVEQVHKRVIEQLIELQREFYFENKGKNTERRSRLREIIERATPAGATNDVA